MAKYRVLYWQTIPSMIEATDDAGKHKIQLSDRFQALIDAAAMRQGLAGTDGYLEQWRRGRAQTREGTAQEVAAAVQAELEAEFTDIRAAAMNKE
jgi:Virulence factor